MKQLEIVSTVLKQMRELRDAHTDAELRQEFNDVCDRLDVLESKLINKNKPKPFLCGCGTWHTINERCGSL